jgi:hypothetical protein
MQPAAILGIGAVTPLGRNLEEIARKLRHVPTARPEELHVSDQLLADPAISKRMRRADRFSRMAAIAALDAWSRSRNQCAGVQPEEIGLIVTAGLGPHCRGFRFLDGLLDCGDRAASPTDFSHSVHGAAAAYITELLELRGPSLSTTDFETGFEDAVMLAQCWLGEGTCQRVLVGAVEELGEVMLHCLSRMIPPDQQIIPAEGAVFLMLGPQVDNKSATIDAANGGREETLPNAIDWNRHFGRSATSSVFDVLGSLLLPEAETTGIVGVSFSQRKASPRLTLHRGSP